VKVVRITTFIFRFVYGRAWKLWNDHVLSATELSFSFSYIAQAVQRESFADEFNKLKKNLPLPSSYQKLSPFISKETFGTRTLTLVRVGGRLAHTDLEPSAKYPILMPKGNRFVHLYIDHLHYAICHAGQRALVGLLRQTIWLINARRECSAVVHRCTHCFRYKPR